MDSAAIGKDRGEQWMFAANSLMRKRGNLLRKKHERTLIELRIFMSLDVAGDFYPAFARTVDIDVRNGGTGENVGKRGQRGPKIHAGLC